MNTLKHNLLLIIWMFLMMGTMIKTAEGQQARNFVTLGGGAIHADGKWGWQGMAHWDLGLGKSWFIDVHGGMDELFNRYEEEFDYWNKNHLYKLGLGARYYFIKGFSARIGLDATLVDFSSDAYLDYFPTFGFAYDIPLAPNHDLEVSFRTDLIGSGSISVDRHALLGLGLSYKFWYGKQD